MLDIRRHALLFTALLLAPASAEIVDLVTNPVEIEKLSLISLSTRFYVSAWGGSTSVSFKDFTVTKRGDSTNVLPIVVFVEESEVEKLAKKELNGLVCDTHGDVLHDVSSQAKLALKETEAVSATLEITKPGVFLAVVVNCGDVALNVKGRIHVKASWGYLSPLESNTLAFYASLLLASTLILVVWIAVFLPKWGNLYGFQKDLGVVLLASVVECGVWYMKLSSWNTGAAPEDNSWRQAMDGLTAIKMSTFAKAIMDCRTGDDRVPSMMQTLLGEAITVAFSLATLVFRQWVGSRHAYNSDFTGGAFRAGFALFVGAVMTWWALATLKEKADDATTASKPGLLSAVVKLNTLVKVLAMVGVLGVALTLCDWTIEVDNPGSWSKHFQIDGVLQVPCMLALMFAMCAWWPNDDLQGYMYNEASAEEVQPIGAQSVVWDDDDDFNEEAQATSESRPPAAE